MRTTISFAWVLSVCALVLLCASYGFAHPASKMDVSFDLKDHMLRVKAYHDVKDAAKHFIHKVEVELNGEKVIDQKFKTQPTLQEQEAVYLILDARPGDQITVTAVCNIAGKKAETLKVEVKPAQAEKQG